MNKHIVIFLSVIFFLSITSCDDLFTPAIENNVPVTTALTDAKFAQGLILDAYSRLPVNGWSFNDVATDDAVTNDISNQYLKMATGQWTSNFNPMNQWSTCKAAIQYLNLFLSLTDQVKWVTDTVASRLYNDRFKGEAYALRALYMYYLLEAHAGWSADNTLLGVPIVLEPEYTSTDFNYPRATFEECMQQIYSDLDKAENLLSLDFEDIATDAQVPSKYPGVDKNTYNRVFGQPGRLLVSGRIAKAFRAKVALLAASPAYSAGNTTTWANAADFAARVIDLNNGVTGIAANGWTWYSEKTNKAEIDAVANGVNPPEMLWRADQASSNDLEMSNYPPTLNGSGRVNPTQNLVDAFPMANGYPITDPASGYNAAAPYSNRDARLQTYILVNGSTAGVNNTVINTASDGTTNDALNKVGTSTRTGYYLRKFLRQDVNLTSGSVTTQKHYKARIRYTEIYLIYAEAANEAWGPMGTGTHSYSAYDVIKAIRKRAGVGTSTNDAYLESIKNDKDKMRELIRNERRLELCFEGFRFWDLRRWNKPLNETAKGMKIQAGTYQTIDVENRVYQDYMNYGPIPYSEILKFSALKQNKGW